MAKDSKEESVVSPRKKSVDEGKKERDSDRKTKREKKEKDTDVKDTEEKKPREKKERRERRESDVKEIKGEKKKKDGEHKEKKKEKDGKDTKDGKEGKDGKENRRKKRKEKEEHKSNDENVVNNNNSDDSKEKKQPEKTEVEEKKKELTEEEIQAFKEQKPNSGTQNRTLLPIQKAPEEEKKKDKKGGLFGLGIFGNKKKEQQMEIGGVISFSHEGHAGFDKDKGGLQTEGLPPNLQEFFNRLNDTMKSLGFDGITQKEMKMVLKKFGHLIIQETSQPKPVEEKQLTYDEIVVKLRDNEVQLAGMKATLSTLQQAKAKFQQEVHDLKELLQEERNNSQNLSKINTNLEFEIAKYREMTGGAGDSNESSSSALQQLENVMRKSIDDVNSKLHSEQQRNLSLQEELQLAIDEKDELRKEIDQMKEMLRQTQELPSVSMPSIPPPPPPNMPTPSHPPPPPPGPSPNLPPPPPPPAMHDNGGNAPSIGLNAIGSVQLKKTEQQEKKVYSDPKADLLSAIRGGATLKHVEAPEINKPKEEDGVLNLIARALIDRRNRIKEGDDSEDSDNGDWDD